MKKALKIVTGIIIVIGVLLIWVTQPIMAKSKVVQGIQVDTLTIRRQVAALANLSPGRSYDNLPSLNAAADTIKNEMQRLGYAVTEQPFKAVGNTYKNLIVQYPAQPKAVDPKTLVIGAHYDVCMDLPGADDNASGVVGLLQIARLLKQHQPQLDYNIEMVAYTLEEPPFFRSDQMGSTVHAKSIQDQNKQLIGMVCLEMIGYFDDTKGSQDYPIGLLKAVYPTTGDYITVVGQMTNGGMVRSMKKHMKAAADIDVRSINAPATLAGIDFSDHLSYWKFDYDAVMITNTGFFRNHAYHTPDDTPDRLDYPKMAETIKGVYNGVIHF